MCHIKICVSRWVAADCCTYATTVVTWLLKAPRAILKCKPHASFDSRQVVCGYYNIQFVFLISGRTVVQYGGFNRLLLSYNYL